MQELNVVVVPTLLIYDREGNLLFAHEGFKPGDQLIIREEIEKHLNAK
jgi:thioredoxin-related protein